MKQEEGVPEAEADTNSALPLARAVLLALLWRLPEPLEVTLALALLKRLPEALALELALALREVLPEVLLEGSGEPLPLPKEDWL